MDTVSFNKKSPKAFILTSDSWSQTSTEEDQVWSLVFNPSDSHPFHLYTTYGLKARAVQVYPKIIFDNHKPHTDQDFIHPPTITQYTPGYLQITYQLKNGLSVTFDTLTPEPSALVGILSLKNQHGKNLDFQLAIVFHLLPLGKGTRSCAERIGTHHLLMGHAGDLHPVLFMSGGPTASFNPLPALALPVQIAPGKSQMINFALAAKQTRGESFKTAKTLTASSWHQVTQKHQMDHAGQTLQIQTGEPDWDAAFHLAQTIPYSHFVQQESDGGSRFVVRKRLPDQPALKPSEVQEKDDLTALELNHMAQVLLPQRADLMEALVINLLNRAHKDGRLYSHRHASPFMKPYEEPPLLAGLCLEIFEITHNQAFLEQTFPTLRQITHTWCFKNSDTKKERSFTWQTPDQCQLYSGHYIFDIWEESGRGLDIHLVESPALLAMLQHETRSLQKIAEILGEPVFVESYAKLEARLEKELLAFWRDEQGIYLYRDIQSQNSPEGEDILNARTGDATIINQHFTTPQRLLCHLRASDERTRVCHLTVTGLDHLSQEVVEVFRPGEIRWIAGRAHLTTIHMFTFLQSIRVKGLAPEDYITLETVDLSQADITCLAPLWSGNLPQAHLDSLLNNLLDWQHPNLNRGIPEVLPVGQEPPEGLQIPVNIIWNSLIIQGLARNGCTEPAAGLFSNLMAPIIEGLRNYDGFYPYFQTKDGKPLGEKNALAGLAPLRLFLEIAGVRVLTPKKVALWGHNPFPWPIEINWQGLSLLRKKSSSRITFPDGTTCDCETTDPVVITPESVTL